MSPKQHRGIPVPIATKEDTRIQRSPTNGVRWLGMAALAVSYQLIALPTLTSLTWTNLGASHIYRIQAQAISGLKHELQASANLKAYSWVRVASEMTTGPSLSIWAVSNVHCPTDGRDVAPSYQ